MSPREHSGRIRESDIAEVKARARIQEILEPYVLLRPAGRDLEGLCPLHEERTPSFHVSPAQQLWYCFGSCQQGGDVFSFLQAKEGVSFAEAVEMVADRIGFSLTYDEASQRRASQRRRLLDANTAAWEWFQSRLLDPDAIDARNWLASKGFTRNDAARFGVGYAPDLGRGHTLQAHLRQKGFTADELTAAGLLGRNDRGLYDYFRGRVIWPIQSAAGEVLGFGGRDHKGISRAKYLNTPDSLLYHKSSVLYGINHAKPTITAERRATIVEGYTDVMACHLAGDTAAVATCGTAFTDQHVNALRPLMFDDEHQARAVFAFDSDDAGQHAALAVFTSADAHFAAATYAATDDQGRDPCDIRLGSGDQALLAMLHKAVPLAQWVLDLTLSKIDLSQPDASQRAVTATTPVIAQMRHPVMRDQAVTYVSHRIGLADTTILATAVRSHTTTQPTQPRQSSSRQPAPQSAPPVPAATKSSMSTSRERELLKLCLRNPDFAYTAIDDLADIQRPIGTPDLAAAFAALQRSCADGEIPDDLADKIITSHREDSQLAGMVAALAVEPLLADLDQHPSYPDTVLNAVRAQALDSEISQLRAQLPTAAPDAAEDLFAQISALERQKHASPAG